MDWGSVLQVVLGAFLGAAFFFIKDLCDNLYIHYTFSLPS